MASHVCVLNETTQRYVKRSQAENWVRDGVCAWVECGVRVRNLSLPEMVAGRAELSRTSELAPVSELPGLVTVAIAKIGEEWDLAAQGTHMVRAGVWIGPWLKPALAGRG